MTVAILNYTNDGERLCAAAMRGCKSKKTAEQILLELKDEDIVRLIRSAIKSRHTSVLEHASITFQISGVSRALTHQLVRHRIASYSQQSQRSVKIDISGDWYVVPYSILNNPNPEVLQRYLAAKKRTAEDYKFYLDNNVPEEDARYDLPNATKTNIVTTMNLRELKHFFKLRTALDAQWEIRDMANVMLALAKEKYPTVFESFQ